ncbi:hypothetical protein [Aerococcus urinaeequi]|uniref:hypothetical protein n=1 Tax=Aerococcus urinaeequi TaxID=51665 RepID=UPI003D6B853D
MKIFLINGESRWTYRPDLRNEEAEPIDVVALKRRTDDTKDIIDALKEVLR